MTDRKGVLVRFPPDVLADLDAEAARTGKSRNEVIVERCLRKAPETTPERPTRRALGGYEGPAGPAPKPPTGGSGLRLGPAPVPPGSRLKRR